MVEWTLFLEGPLTTPHLLRVLEAHPYWGGEIAQDKDSEARIRSVLADAWERGTLAFRFEVGAWSCPRPPNSKFPELSAECGTFRNVIRGEGSESVYCLFDPVQRYRQVVRGGDCWPIKIGRTSRKLTLRLRELQCGSHVPLSIGLVYRTHDSAAVETCLHERFHQSRMNGAGRSREWFWTNLVAIDMAWRELVSIG
jgi:hypothetical protein